MEPNTHNKRNAPNTQGPKSAESGGIPLALLAWIIGVPGVIALLLLLF